MLQCNSAAFQNNDKLFLKENQWHSQTVSGFQGLSKQGFGISPFVLNIISNCVIAIDFMRSCLIKEFDRAVLATRNKAYKAKKSKCRLRRVTGTMHLLLRHNTMDLTAPTYFILMPSCFLQLDAISLWAVMWFKAKTAMHFLKTNADFLVRIYSIRIILFYDSVPQTNSHILFSLFMLPFPNDAENKLALRNRLTSPPPHPHASQTVNIKRLFSLFQLAVLVTTQELDWDLAMYYSLDFFL